MNAITMKDRATNVIMSKLGRVGRLISASKSGYRQRFPKNFTIFNANIFLESKEYIGKVWFGDIDLTKDFKLIKDAAEELKQYDESCVLYILSEMSGRFENECNPKFKEDSFWNTSTGLSETYKQFVNNETLKYK